MNDHRVLECFGLALGGWLLSDAAAFPAFLLQFCGMEKTGDTVSESLLSCGYLAVQPVWYTWGAVLSLACFVLIWRLLLRRSLLNLFSQKKGWLVLWSVLAVISLLIQFILFWIAVFMETSLFDSPYPEWTVCFGFVYVGFALILMLTDTILTVRKQNLRNSSAGTSLS